MVLMNTEIQKKVKERQNKKQKQSMKGQSSIEYPMMIAIALIIIAIAIVVILSVGGKTAKAGTIHAELLSAEVTDGTLSIATNLPLSLSGSSAGTATGTTSPAINDPIGPYNVSGGYEYTFSETANALAPGDSITSISITGSSGTKISLVPASGTNVTVTSGTAPFTITNIGS